MRRFAALGGLNAFLAVAAGAFAAHALRERLDPHHLDIFETGARYHMVHALGLIAVAWLVSRGAPGAAYAGWAMLVGIVLFCGSLYALALSGVGLFGAITPFGGTAFLAGWGIFVYAARRA